VRNAVVLVTLFSLSGCLASNPAKGTAATGEPLLLKVERGTGTYTRNEVVSKDTVRNTDGHIVGTIEHRADVEHSFRWHDTFFFQGESRLDEQDFYRLAGDSESEHRVAGHRRSAARIQKAGLGIMLLSLVAGGALVGIGLANGDNALAVKGVIPIAIGIPLGGLVLARGGHKMRKKVLPDKRAAEAADVVRFCDDGDCIEGPGLRKFRGSQPTSLGMRDETPPADTTPPSTTGDGGASVFGLWGGKVTMEMLADGKDKPKTTHSRGAVSIKDAGGGSLEVNLDPEHEGCIVRGTLEGNAVVLEASSCRIDRGKSEIQVKSGTLTLRGDELVVEIQAEVTMGKQHGTATWSGSLTR
jgi:hypothetical protein